MTDSDSVLQPHGVDASVSAAGEETGVEATGNPDCLAGEGPCVTAGGN